MCTHTHTFFDIFNDAFWGCTGAHKGVKSIALRALGWGFGVLRAVALYRDCGYVWVIRTKAHVQ